VVSERRYVEPARTYVTSAALLLVLLVGFVVDLALGGGKTHALAWALAALIVVGADALTVYAARSLRSIIVTDTELRVGEEAVDRTEIVAVENDPNADARVLGRRHGEGVPRGTVGLLVRLRDGSRVAVPTRDPKRLVAALDVSEARTFVRRADTEDLPLLPEIDERADLLFRVFGVDLPQIPVVADAMNDAKAIFVVGHPPIGYVQVDEVDGLAHVQEIAVLPSHMRQGLGTALLDAACAWAREHDYRAITLCTYAEVPWNGPFYSRRGFVELEDLTPGLVELRDWERDIGLDERGRRFVMRRQL